VHQRQRRRPRDGVLTKQGFEKDDIFSDAALSAARRRAHLHTHANTRYCQRRRAAFWRAGAARHAGRAKRVGRFHGAGDCREGRWCKGAG
jgi:hypothetical protein